MIVPSLPIAIIRDDWPEVGASSSKLSLTDPTWTVIRCVPGGNPRA
ncbi:MAG: hypothetical protein ACYDAN_14420 [Candidatus Limnocylindrales bacterium]